MITEKEFRMNIKKPIRFMIAVAVSRKAAVRWKQTAVKNTADFFG